MASSQKDPGKAVMSPAHLQRAAFMAVLSFLFFLAMMIAFYVRQSMLYFLLASAFLIIYIFTMVSLIRMRKRQTHLR